MSDIRTVTVLGTGVLGSQIAYQAAYSGFAVTAYDINDAAIEAAAKRFAGLAETYKAEVAGAADEKADAALRNLTLSSNLAEAVADADIVIEAVPENLEIKRDTYAKLAELAPAKTIFATNSSTLLPSDMVGFTGRPERFLAMHFANRIWVHNIAEVMGTPATDPAVVQTVLEFGAEIGMVPVEIKKEKAGYLLNSLLVPFLSAAGELLVDGIAEPVDIDNTWRISTGAPMGPFQIYDMVGLTTAYNVSANGGPKQREFAALIKERYIDQGKLGMSTGEGFYTYPAK
ncbi:3-hydroxyacyl-CoA dehydrogenase [Microterricola pindariensis]|uniref:3-hydroxybutyryl-CoA dehydrogenase n=1 Tax=Microterricola pindariensis TaxID=478010 RepID=A0ABX5AXJ6_9MICO|nr:3-hydroxyacyl-CoA dehydrogenase [Microterricola pindariensis]PPL19570.1 3-hydroxybutyryl-CoA dehydrogenase [Microterricola pindariensis]